ncbi:Imm10 family immunity protein [Streptomyces sp. NBC_01243]|uniref:Imm10 family immunity protein n=1 Tax=Streptomyces sp. NBC_01243 TaxID=2903796 RepID=UPI002E13FD3E
MENSGARMMSEPRQWEVRTVTSSPNVPDDCFVVGISEDTEGSERYFIFQSRLSAPSAQARRLEMDSYCTVTESGDVNYGGLENVVITPASITLYFNEEAVEELSLSGRRVTLGLAPEVDVPLLVSGLRKVLFYGNAEKHPRFHDPFEEG